MLHLPWAGLVAIRPGCQRPHRADIDAHPAFFALEMVLFVRNDQLRGIAVGDAQGPYVHSLATNANTSIAHDAARAIEVNDGRPLLLIAMIFDID